MPRLAQQACKRAWAASKSWPSYSWLPGTNTTGVGQPCSGENWRKPKSLSAIRWPGW